MAKNKLSDLNNHLFAQLERLGDEDKSGDDLKLEVERSKAMANVAKEIVATGKLALDAEKLMSAGEIQKRPAMLAISPVMQH